MYNIVNRYYQLKKKQKDIEQELVELRGEILDHCTEKAVSTLEVGEYKVKIVPQQRKEFDDHKLYAALPDPELWRMLSRADPSKIASLLKLNVISEEKIKDTFSLKTINVLQVVKE